MLTSEGHKNLPGWRPHGCSRRCTCSAAVGSPTGVSARREPRCSASGSARPCTRRTWTRSATMVFCLQFTKSKSNQSGLGETRYSASIITSGTMCQRTSARTLSSVDNYIFPCIYNQYTGVSSYSMAVLWNSSITYVYRSRIVRLVCLCLNYVYILIHIKYITMYE